MNPIRNKLGLGKKYSLSGQKHRDTRDALLMLLPFLLLFCYFIVLPILSSIGLSFTYFDMVQPPQYIGIRNYIRMFLDDDVFLKSLSNTLVFAIITGPIGYISCLLFAWLINELPRRVRSFMTLVFYAPTISGSVYVMWTFIFSGDSYGLINGALRNLGLINKPIQFLTDPKYMLVIIMIVQIWMSLGTAFLSFIAGLQNVDRQLYEAGAIDGIKNRWQELFYITLPSMGPQLQFGAVMQIGASFSVSQIAIALTGFPSTDNAGSTIVTHIMDVGTLRYEMGYGSAISVFLFAIMLFTNFVLSNILRAVTKDD